jgi:hypothetical protein
LGLYGFESGSIGRVLANLPSGSGSAYALGNLDGDRRADLAISDAAISTTDHFIGIASSAEAAGAAGLLPWPQRIPTDGLMPGLTLRALADVDRDTEADYLLAFGWTLAIARNEPGPSVAFREPEHVLLPGTPEDIAVDDLDRDASPDIVLATPAGVTVLGLGPGGGFETRAVLRGNATRVQIVDIEGDRRADLVSWDGSRQRFGCFLQEPGGTFREPPIEFAVDPGWHDFAFDDLDGDGRSELVLVHEDRVTVARQDAPAASFGPPLTVFLDLSSRPSELAIADVDGDGDRDLVLGDRGVPGFHVLHTIPVPGALRFERDSHPLPFAADHLELVDVDGNCRPAVVTVAAGRPFVSIGLPGAPGTLRDLRHYSAHGLQEITRLLSGDLDGDGIEDLVITGDRPGELGYALLGR